MRIIDVPEYIHRKQLLTLAEDAMLIDAIKKMQEFKVGAILITDNNNKLLGIFTERDLLMKVAGFNLNINQTKLSDVMTKEVQTAHVNDEVQECMKRMTEGKFRHLPVIDEQGSLIGIISQGDFVSISWSQLLQQLTEKTKKSFFSMTQIWMLAIGLLGYLILIYMLFV